MPVSQQNFAQVQAQRSKPVNPRVLMVLAAIAVVLIAIIVIRFVAFGGTASEYGAVQDSIKQEQAQIAELEQSNDELQAKMDSMQGLIDEYNSTKR